MDSAQENRITKQLQSLAEGLENVTRGFPKNDPVGHRQEHESMGETLAELLEFFKAAKSGLIVLGYIGKIAKWLAPIIVVSGSVWAVFKDHWK